MKTPTNIRSRQYSTQGGGVLSVLLIAVTLFCSKPVFAEAPGKLPESYTWRTAVNNLNLVPGTDSKLFNSYNQPSVSSRGIVAFRARSKGPDTMSGIYRRNMNPSGGGIEMIFDRNTTVPTPNNTVYPPENNLANFIEFPSIPRLSSLTGTVATRGNSQPTWTYPTGDTETKVGTTGIFIGYSTNRLTGASQHGAVPPPTGPGYGINYFPYMQVPGTVAGTKFDVFPGSPAVADGDVIVFKGNYTEDNVGKTGIFFRDPLGNSGQAPVKLIANTSTLIPNLPEGVTGVAFGSTAPPSAAGTNVVFAGFDNEETPTYGGIYLAPLSPAPTLQTLVGIGDPVPGETGETFAKFGEGLSYDGRYVAFWGAWGSETKTLWLDCPEDGNADLLAYCEEFVGDDFPVQVPVNQGIFVVDTATGEVSRIARTGESFADFLFWTFSGKPPGVGESDESDGELPRWRSSAFTTVSRDLDGKYLVAFKGRNGVIDPVENNYVAPLDGIYLGNGAQVDALLDTSMPGQFLDPAAPEGSAISAVSIERESFRGSWFAVTASMLEPISGASMAGIYSTRIPAPPLSADFTGDGKADILWRHERDGRVRIWQMDGTNRTAVTDLPRVVDLGWRIGGANDLTGDGRADILWRHVRDGRVRVWQMDGTNRTAIIELPRVADVNWRTRGTRDFTGDGKIDILWRHVRDGRVRVWQMDGTNRTAIIDLPRLADVRWDIAGASDITGDGNTDILWRNEGNGAVQLWEMDRTNRVSGIGLPRVVGTAWRIRGTSDLTGDGKEDILWQNTTNGGIRLWEMDGTNRVDTVDIPGVQDLGWRIYNR
jgi:hypothetical protein